MDIAARLFFPFQVAQQLRFKVLAHGLLDRTPLSRNALLLGQAVAARARVCGIRREVLNLWPLLADLGFPWSSVGFHSNAIAIRRAAS
jgi:hypothetical protein